MTSDEEIQKQIDEQTAPERRRSERLRFILKMAIAGAVLVGLTLPAMVFLNIPGLSLETEIGIVDSMLYSMGGRTIVIALAGMIWSIPGAIVGGILGCAYSMLGR